MSHHESSHRIRQLFIIIIMPNNHTLYYMIEPLMGACMYDHVMYGVLLSAKHTYAEVTQETGLGWALRTACPRNVLFSPFGLTLRVDTSLCVSFICFC